MTQAIAKEGGEFPLSVERLDDLMLNAPRVVRYHSRSSGSVQLGKCTYRSKYHRYTTYDGLHDGLWGLTNSHQPALCSTLGHSAAQAGRRLRATACGAGALELTPGAQLVLTSVQALKCTRP